MKKKLSISKWMQRKIDLIEIVALHLKEILMAEAIRNYHQFLFVTLFNASTVRCITSARICF